MPCKDGKKHGPAKVYYKGGILKWEGSFENRNKHGVFKGFIKTET